MTSGELRVVTEETVQGKSELRDVPRDGQTLAVCGVVTATIKRFR